MSTIRIVLLSVCALGLSACYEPAGVTVHQPGVYKGPKDPLLSTDGDARRQELMARFNQVQRDR